MLLFQTSLNFYTFGLCLLCIGFLLPSITDGIRLQHRHVSYNKKQKNFHRKSFLKPRCDSKCTSSETTTDLPELFTITDDPSSLSTELTMTTSVSMNQSSESELVPPYPMSTTMTGIVHFDELTKLLQLKRKQCKKSNLGTFFLGKKIGSKTFTCEKLKLSSWFLDQLEKNSTDLFISYVKLVKNRNISDVIQEVELVPESGFEKFMFRLINTFGEPVDKLLFYQFKKYTKSRELQVNIPNLVEVHLSPRSRAELDTGRTLFDPGFNMKLKFPFFHDELKVAVSTGPSFLAGLGVGLVVLGIKSIFAPFVLAMKAVILSWFFKDMSPMELVKTMAGPILPTWLSGMQREPEAHYSGWQQSVEHYQPPHVYNSYDSYGGHGQKEKQTKGLMGALTHLLPFTSYDQNHQFSQPNPNFQNQRPVSHGGYSSSGGSYRPNLNVDGEGRTQIIPSTEFDNDGGGPEMSGGDESQDHHDTSFVPPTGLELEVENFDPFYSPLLSRIDSIFMHLGFNEEGCKERAVCSIYKYPVKYAPYSNLLSAQLSKHQSELKRPVNTSPKVLRYFKYMKAAKDGQAALNCMELYPKCTSDTEKLTNLPMVKTFQQLTELMGTGPSG